MAELNNVMQLRTIPDLMDKKYFIPEYQRGYRWESLQIEQLLDDLLLYFNDLKDDSDFYCLQPVVVKLCDEETRIDNNLDGEDWYEVIDGQQRLTTIRIICALLDSANGTPGWHTYHIRYATRPDMDKIYETLAVRFDPSTRTRVFEPAAPKWNNLDSVYIYNAANTIVNWFNGGANRKGLFDSHFFNPESEKKSVRVVWYEDCGIKDAREIFNELNDLTVKLSCSELIRSLFLSSTTKYEYSSSLDNLPNDIKEKLADQETKNYQRYINTKWDEIEAKLSHPRMKAFVTNTSKKEMRNSIELLFDLIAEKNVYTDKDKTKRDPLYTFLYFVREIKENGASKMWQLVEQYYSRICGWYEDRDYYHWIGFLTALAKDDRTMTSLLKFASENSKSSLNQEVKNMIRSEVVLPKKISNFDELNYKDHYDYIRKLLFLYNVELSRKMLNQDVFPFELFKPITDWTLEHIHAQNSECLPSNNTDVWKEWATYTIETLGHLHFEQQFEETKLSLIARLKDILQRLIDKDRTCTFDDEIAPMFDDVATLFKDVNSDSDIPNKVPVHQLSNMTLLSQEVNSSIGCSFFAIKREQIISMRNKGTYFPLGTMNVFQKSFTNNQQLFEWSYEDRQAYMVSIMSNINPYL